MSQIETAVRGSKKIEALLRDRFGAEGRGLHEYLNSVEHRIPEDIVRKARFIASVRNKVIHEEGESFDLDSFNQAVEYVTSGLNKILLWEQAEREKEAHRQSKFHERMDTRKPSKSVSRFWILVAITSVLYFWWQHQEEKYNRTRDAKKHSQQLEALRSQLADLKAQLVSVEQTSLQKTAVSQASVPPVIEKTIPVRQKATRSPELKEIQLRLNTLGYAAGMPDGLPGPATSAAIRKFEEQNKLLVDGKLSAAERALLSSKEAIPAKNVSRGTLLAKARLSSSEYDQAYDDIAGKLVRLFREKTAVTLGSADVAQNTDGTYNVRVPVSWKMPEQEVLSLLSRYFNGSQGSPLSLSGGEVKIRKYHAESSSAVKPYSGRLFEALQKIEIEIEVSLGRKMSKLVIAGNANCFVSCDYSQKPSTDWIVQTRGEPGEPTLSYKQETPVVIEGLTESDLQHVGLPVAVVR